MAEKFHLLSIGTGIRERYPKISSKPFTYLTQNNNMIHDSAQHLLMIMLNNNNNDGGDDDDDDDFIQHFAAFGASYALLAWSSDWLFVLLAVF